MEDFMAFVAQVVGGAVLQEMVSRGASLVLGKRKDKASQEQCYLMERFNKAVHEVEFVLERTSKLPITEVSLLRDRIELKRHFVQAACLLNKNKKSKTHIGGQRETIPQAVTCSSSSPPQDLAAMSPVSSFISTMSRELSCDDVERFERFAESARNIIGRVESGCSLRRYMFFPSPLVRHLLEWKTLHYQNVQADQERHLFMWPTCLHGERGVEAWIGHMYLDHKRPNKSFLIGLVLRLSESTDIVGIATNCIQSMTSEFNLMVDTATILGELTLLANLHGISHSNAPPWVGIQQNYNEIIHEYRPDPLCCKDKGHGPPDVNNVVSSELSHIFPEEVIYFYFQCCVSAPEYSSCLRSSADAAGKRSVMRTRMPPLKLAFCLVPHYVPEERLQTSYATEAIGDDSDDQHTDASMQQLGETVRSRAINCFLHQPDVTDYSLGWATRHGAAYFFVEKRRAGALKTSGRSKSGGSAKAKVLARSAQQQWMTSHRR